MSSTLLFSWITWIIICDITHCRVLCSCITNRSSREWIEPRTGVFFSVGLSTKSHSLYSLKTCFQSGKHWILQLCRLSNMVWRWLMLCFFLSFLFIYFIQHSFRYISLRLVTSITWETWETFLCCDKNLSSNYNYVYYT